MEHQSVLLNESLDLLDVKKDGIYVDCTLGRGGHSAEILKRAPEGYLYAFDLDPQAIEQSRGRLEAISDRFCLIHDSFDQLKNRLNEKGVDAVDGIFLDLGVSSPQFDDPERGFSYRHDARLDMRMNPEQSLDAWTIVNTYSQQELTRIFEQYGEDPFSSRIARRIVEKRQEKPIDTTFELVDTIKEALPAKVLSKKGHPAKRIFQALRIETNRELDQLDSVLEQAVSLLKPGGRLAVITFHSLEDRKVKQFFNSLAKPPKVSRRIPTPPKEMEYRLVNRKAITASQEELEQNHRSHSAKLRGLEKNGG